MSEALNVARKMKAKYTVLTHFSSRYQKLPLLSEQFFGPQANVSVAFDNMRFSMWQLSKLHFSLPLLKSVFVYF